MILNVVKLEELAVRTWILGQINVRVGDNGNGRPRSIE